jgi:hypothetical protein
MNKIIKTNMTFREYFSITIVTTKSCLRITSIVFMVCFVVLFLALKIGGKLGEEETFVQVYNSIGYFIFVYGLTLFIWVLALTSSYNKAKNTTKLFNSIALDIKEKFCFQLYAKQHNIKYNYLDFEIFGLFENSCLVIDKVQKNVRIILCAMLNTNRNFQQQKISFDKKYKVNNIELNGYGLLKKINTREWNQISASEIEKYIRELVKIAQMDGFSIIRSNFTVDKND